MGRIHVCLMCCLQVTIRGLVGSYNKKTLLHGTQVAFSPDRTPQHKGLQLVCCIVTTYGMVPVYGWDASTREVSGNFSTSFISNSTASHSPESILEHRSMCQTNVGGCVAVAHLNWGAPLTGTDNIKRICCITGTNETVVLCEWDTRLREMSNMMMMMLCLFKEFSKES
jgi:hypothetical protein